jgi:hypothetical protein
MSKRIAARGNHKSGERRVILSARMLDAFFAFPGRSDSN